MFTMKLQRVVLVLIGLMVLSVGRSAAQQVKTDYDRSADFSQYKTYSWEHIKTQDPLDVDRIKNAVNAALMEKGWTQVESGGDVSLVAIQMTHNQQTLNTFYDEFGAGWGWRRFGGWNHWGCDWHGHRVIYNHNTYISHSRTIINRNNFNHANFNHGNFNHGNVNHGNAFHGPSAFHSGTHSGAFSGFDHGGNALGFSSRGRSSFGGGFQGGGGFHGGGGGHR